MRKFITLIVRTVGLVSVGLLAGYLLGRWNAGEQEAMLAREQANRAGVEQALEQQQARLGRLRDSHRRQQARLRTEAELLRALVQIQQNNFGLASQHLGVAHRQVKSMAQAAKQPAKELLDSVIAEIGGAHGMAMRLDPMARLQIERTLKRLEQLPGSR